MVSLRDSIQHVPLAYDQDRAVDILDRLDPSLRQGDMGELLAGAAGSSPYLCRLLTRYGDWLTEAATQDLQDALGILIAHLQTGVLNSDNAANLGKHLRQTKGRAALLIALADLAGAWTLQEVTKALTRLADAACVSAAQWLLTKELDAGKLPGLEMDAIDHGAGYILIAMGKMGSGELNYSSDIDLIALFDDGLFEGDDVLEARSRFIHVTRQLVKLLSENTADGYVFRTDLRLRPSPSTTPVCMARDAAERYYESVGRTWERAAHIKARALVDTRAGDEYLAALSPFIWRRHLDFAAIDDIHEMLRKIRAQRAQFHAGTVPGHNIKLGPGGIREIEFFAQTRQLIMGGRNPDLRVSNTVGALKALADNGVIDRSQADTLTQDYEELRSLEHRLQMIEDAQTHTIPTATEARDRLAALSGQPDRDAFEGSIARRLARIHALTEEFFRPGAAEDRPLPAPMDAALTAFDRPEDAARQLERWRSGQIAATRSERAQGLFAQLEPQIITRLARAANPDQALSHFDRFLSGLPSGVQVFSLFSANPQLLDLIISICTVAPRLAGYLGRRSGALDTLLDRDFWEPLGSVEALRKDFEAAMQGETDYERLLDASRRWSRDLWFRVGVHVIRGVVDANAAGAEYTAIAETYISGLLPHVIANFAVRHGPPPGNGVAVLAFGKLGSGEMTASSDLDIITIYDPDGVESSEGPRPLPPGVYYPRLTQALVSALTAPTAEGALYEVDMRLRPSGSQGPVAVSRTAFETYHREKAWVWEHLALTRARCIAGPKNLTDTIGTIISNVLRARAGDPAILPEAAEMRGRLIQANRAERDDPWSLKHAAGGLMEIEFLAQTGVLLHGLDGVRSVREALPALTTADWLTEEDTAVLQSAFDLQQSLQQIERVAIEGSFDPAAIGDELRTVLANAAEAEEFDTLEQKLVSAQSEAADLAKGMFDG
ncbi:MAG: bifunctional [glutamine synthetase] adenylyltransferase/[glutamine synthetase]-adenylyl-L-tyrosine phosphorylase [Pseudomonadota bacterium]